MNLEAQIVHGQFGTPILLLLAANLEMSKFAFWRTKYGINLVTIASNLNAKNEYFKINFIIALYI